MPPPPPVQCWVASPDRKLDSQHWTGGEGGRADRPNNFGHDCSSPDKACWSSWTSYRSARETAGTGAEQMLRRSVDVHIAEHIFSFWFFFSRETNDDRSNLSPTTCYYTFSMDWQGHNHTLGLCKYTSYADLWRQISPIPFQNHIHSSSTPSPRATCFAALFLLPGFAIHLVTSLHV